MAKKNTRLIYTDEKHITMYDAMPAEQFKELMLTMLKYQYGDDSIIDTIQDPMVKALFLMEKSSIDTNEKKWAERAKIARENGAKSKGRPPKKVSEEEKDKWVESLVKDTNPSRDDKFEEGWNNYFDDKDDAVVFALSYLNDNGVHISKIGR